MQDLLITNVYIFILAIVLAILEIQIEGKHGWAMNLPTWRPKGNRLVDFYQKMMSGREPTGYHMSMFTFVLLILHFPYVFGLDWTLLNEMKTISLFFIFIVLWDFLWFVLNPHHPLKKFKKEHIWWHKKWWAGLPADYYMSVLLSFLILLPTAWYYQNYQVLDWWLINMSLFVIETIFLILFSFAVLDIDNWNKRK